MKRNWLSQIRRCFGADAVYYSQHAKYEMESEEFGRIYDDEIGEVIDSGEVIEEYPGAKPYPSALIFGMTEKGRPIHCVCAHDEDEDQVIIVTVYQPDPERWIDFKKRRRK